MPLPHIGLTGPAGAGKDTVARLLIEMEPRYARVAFADKLKTMALAVDPMVQTVWPARLSQIVANRGWERAKEIPEVRRFLQNLGVAARDHLGEDVWVNAAAPAVEAHNGPCVFTDVRFPNEVEYARSNGGVIVRIERPNVVKLAHVSETSISEADVDYRLYNDSSVFALRETVYDMLTDIKRLVGR